MSGFDFTIDGAIAFAGASYGSAADGGTLKFYSGPPITTAVIPGANVLLATATLGTPSFVSNLANVTATSVAVSGIPTSAVLCKADGTILSRHTVAGRKGLADILINDGTVGGATSPLATLTAGGTFTVTFRVPVAGGSTGIGDGVTVIDGTAIFAPTFAAYASGATPGTYTSGDLMPVYRPGSSAVVLIPAASGGSSTPTIVTKTANYTVVDTDDIIWVDATSGAVVITFPLANTLTRPKTIKKIAGAGAVTIATTSSQTIDGTVPPITVGLYTSLTIVPTSPNFYVI